MIAAASYLCAPPIPTVCITRYSRKTHNESACCAPGIAFLMRVQVHKHIARTKTRELYLF